MLGGKERLAEGEGESLRDRHSRWPRPVRKRRSRHPGLVLGKARGREVRISGSLEDTGEVG